MSTLPAVVVINLPRRVKKEDVLIAFLAQAASVLSATVSNGKTDKYEIIYQCLSENHCIRARYCEKITCQPIVVVDPPDSAFLWFTINAACPGEMKSEFERLINEEWLPTILEYAGVPSLKVELRVNEPKKQPTS